MGNDNEGPSNPLAGDGPTSVENAAEAFTEMLVQEDKPRETKPTREPRRKRDDEDRDPGDGDDGQPDAGAASDPDEDPLKDDILDAEAPKEGDEDDEEADDEDGDGDEDDEDGGEDPEHEVVVNGKTEKVKLSELQAGYSREADYRQKTQALSQARGEVEEYARESVAHRKNLQTAVENVTALFSLVIPSKQEMEDLKAKDPNAYIAMSDYWSGIRVKVDELNSERERLAQEHGSTSQREHSTYANEEGRKLISIVPALADPKKADEFRGRIFAYGKRNGYSEEEIMGIVDHRDIMTAYKAARYDEIMASRKGNKAPKNGPKNINSGRPRSVGKGKNSGTGRTQESADRRLARTGKSEDAAMAFTEMLSGRH